MENCNIIELKNYQKHESCMLRKNENTMKLYADYKFRHFTGNYFEDDNTFFALYASHEGPMIYYDGTEYSIKPNLDIKVIYDNSNEDEDKPNRRKICVIHDYDIYIEYDEPLFGYNSWSEKIDVDLFFKLEQEYKTRKFYANYTIPYSFDWLSDIVHEDKIYKFKPEIKSYSSSGIIELADAISCHYSDFNPQTGELKKNKEKIQKHFTGVYNEFEDTFVALYPTESGPILYYNNNEYLIKPDLEIEYKNDNNGKKIFEIKEYGLTIRNYAVKKYDRNIWNGPYIVSILYKIAARYKTREFYERYTLPFKCIFEQIDKEL